MRSKEHFHSQNRNKQLRHQNHFSYHQVSEFDQEIPQSHTEYQPTAP